MWKFKALKKNEWKYWRQNREEVVIEKDDKISQIIQQMEVIGEGEQIVDDKMNKRWFKIIVFIKKISGS